MKGKDFRLSSECFLLHYLLAHAHSLGCVWRASASLSVVSKLFGALAFASGLRGFLTIKFPENLEEFSFVEF